MGVVIVNLGGFDYYCAEASEQNKWRMCWDEFNIVQDFLEGTAELLMLKPAEGGGAFEADTRDELIAKIDELELYFDPEIEGE
ncbi:MAG: hypothetical protein ACFFCX_17650 [Candidatus Sifarchaeia archaeon]